jgi:DNA-directed RNA polymerase II subunit RPB3
MSKIFTVLKRQPTSITLNVTNIDTKTMNKLRISIMSEIPTIAIDTVTIDQNTTSFLDEILAHRLCLVPIQIIDPSILNCSCPCNTNTLLDANNEDNACGGCQIEFELSTTCNSGEGYVTTSLLRTKSDKVKMAYSDIPIVQIQHGQTLAFKAKTQKGIGDTHAKWSPVSVISFDETPETRPTADDSEIVRNGIEMVTKGGKLIPKIFELYFETNGKMSPDDVLRAGIDLVPEIKSNFIVNG